MNKTSRIIILPLLLSMFMIRWLMCWVGEPKAAPHLVRDTIQIGVYFTADALLEA